MEAGAVGQLTFSNAQLLYLLNMLIFEKLKKKFKLS